MHRRWITRAEWIAGIILVLPWVWTGCGNKDLAKPGYQPYAKPETKAQTSDGPASSSGGSSTSSTAGGTPSSAQSTSSGTTAGGDNKAQASSTSCSDHAQSIFNTNIQPSIAAVCSTCHLATHKLALIGSDPTGNRSRLRAFIGTGDDGSKLADFIRADPPHKGGAQLQSMPAAKIKEWAAVESSCNDG